MAQKVPFTHLLLAVPSHPVRKNATTLFLSAALPMFVPRILSLSW